MQPMRFNTKHVVGIRRGKLVKNLPEQVRDACELRRKARVTKLNSPHNNQNIMEYRRLNKKVKYEVKKWKWRPHMHKMTAMR